MGGVTGQSLFQLFKDWNHLKLDKGHRQRHQLGRERARAQRPVMLPSNPAPDPTHPIPFLGTQAGREGEEEGREPLRRAKGWLGRAFPVCSSKVGRGSNRDPLSHEPARSSSQF